MSFKTLTLLCGLTLAAALAGCGPTEPTAEVEMPPPATTTEPGGPMAPEVGGEMTGPAPKIEGPGEAVAPAPLEAPQPSEPVKTETPKAEPPAEEPKG
jgi:hypothetical protein